MDASAEWLQPTDDDDDYEDDRSDRDDREEYLEETEEDSGDEDDDETAVADDHGVPDLDEAEAAIANAHVDEVESHRNLIGDVLSHLTEDGYDVESIAEDAGVSSDDVQELTHGDLAAMTQYLAQNHPELLEAMSDRYPAAQNVLNAVTGGGGIGGIVGRFLGRD